MAFHVVLIYYVNIKASKLAILVDYMKKSINPIDPKVLNLISKLTKCLLSYRSILESARAKGKKYVG